MFFPDDFISVNMTHGVLSEKGKRKMITIEKKINDPGKANVIFYIYLSLNLFNLVFTKSCLF